MSESYNPDLRANPFVQDIGREESEKTFSQTPMMLVDHEDHDKHWIGESLPVPSIAEVKPSGSVTHQGFSPFPARADHKHDNQALWAIIGRNAAKFCPPGQTFINTLVYTQGSVGWPAISGNQIITFPREGNYILVTNWFMERDGGGYFLNQSEIRSWFNNGTYNRIMWREPLGGSTFVESSGPRVASFTDQFGTQVGGGATDNIQFSYNHNDAVGHYVYLEFMYLVRVSNYNYVA